MSIQRAILLINLLLITLGAYFGAGLFYQIWAIRIRPAQLEPMDQAKASASAELSSKPYTAYSAILQRDLFKVQKASQTPAGKAKINLEDMEQTKLQLKLWGTVTGDSQQSYAVIEDVRKREQNLYRVGDNVQEATVKAILRTKVVLTVDGQDQILAMEEIQQSRASRYVPPRPGPSESRATTRASRPMRAQRVSLRRSMIDEAIQDVSKLMTEIKIQPHEDGLALSSIKPNSIFRRMGLRNGDVLKSVDGQQIRSVDDALKLYESLKSADRVSVELKRRGADRMINYNIR